MNLKVVDSEWRPNRKYLRHLDCSRGHIKQRYDKVYFCHECKQELKDPYYLCMLMFNLVQPIGKFDIYQID